MKTKEKNVNIKYLSLLFASLWTAIVLFSFYVNMLDDNHHYIDYAIAEARGDYKIDFMYRRWVSSSGGIYVFLQNTIPPNQYLSHIQNRDITTTNGLKLTLINPAYMARMVYSLGTERYGTVRHVTSLNPLRPENKPDSWEEKALKEFAKGADEVSSVEKIAGKQYLRFMRPMTTEKGCLKCHSIQGYKVGEVRGGISISIPLKPFSSVFWELERWLLIGHVLIWLAGFSGIIFSSTALSHHIRNKDFIEDELRKHRDNLEILVSERTEQVGKMNLDLLGEIEGRRLIEEALRDRENQISLILNSTGEAIYGIDLNGNCTFANASCLRLLDYKNVDELIGKNMHDLIHHTRPDGTHYPIEECLIYRSFKKGEGTHLADEVLWRADGSSFSAEYWSLPIFKNDAIVGSVVTFVDITDRVKKEKLLHESEIRYRSLFEDSAVAIWEQDFSKIKSYLDSLRNSGITDLRVFFKENPQEILHCAALRKVLDVNQESLIFFGVDKKEDIQKNLPYFFLSDSWPVFIKEITALAKGADRFESEIPVTNLAGEKKMAILRLSVANEFKDSLSRVLVSFIDITDRKLMEIKIKESEKEFKALYDNSPDALFVSDMEGRFLDVNANACLLVGYEKDDLLKESIWKITDDEKEAEISNALGAITYSQKTELESILIDLNGNKIPVDMSISIMELRGANVLLLIARDITVRKKQEAEVLTLLNEQEILMSKQDKLLNMIKSKNEDLEAFAGTLSHDLKTPLVTISGFVGAILEDCPETLDSDGRIYLRKISNAADKMKSLIGNVLEYTRIGMTDEATTTVPLKKVVNSVLEMLEGMVAKSQAVITITPESEEVSITGEETRIRQVFQNLISNAIKYSSKTNPQIEIGVLENDNEKIFYVKDNGIGIKLEDENRLFQMFNRISPTNKVEGTGIGLASVKRIVEKHSGRIWVESEPGKGSAFFFTLGDMKTL